MEQKADGQNGFNTAAEKVLEASEILNILTSPRTREDDIFISAFIEDMITAEAELKLIYRRMKV